MSAETSGEEVFTNQNDIVQKFASMREELNSIWTKMNELSSDGSEHRQVISALEPMASDRKCFRLIGDVLVERTVSEVLPAVKSTEEQIRKTLETLAKEVEVKKERLAAFQTKYKIRVKGEDGEDEEEPQNSGNAKNDQAGASSHGVLVSSS
ncbi:hypothetical protein BSKO_07821 [Bryopsis sp. KO-2023]|nr:hypothetical protein BSKO_07821 [Bryopsis sp. KO-2023]